MSSNDPRKRQLKASSGEAPASTESPQDGTAIKKQKANNETVAAPENPNPAPVNLVANPGSNPNIPWDGLLRPLFLIDAVHLESVSATFREFVFTGQYRLVWNSQYRNCLVDNHGLARSSANSALVFLVTKISPYCRQLILKNRQHPPKPFDTQIFANLPKLESLYLKYFSPGNRTIDVMNEPFLLFFANVPTTLAALRNTVKAEIRINVDPRFCPKSLTKPIPHPEFASVFNRFGTFLAEIRNSLISLQFAPFERYNKRTRETNRFKLDLGSLKLQDGNVHLRKLRVAFHRDDTEESYWGQYESVLKAVIEHLDILYIKWGEENTLTLNHFVHKTADPFLYALWPIWNKRTRKNCKPITLQALAIDFNWVNVSFGEEFYRSWFSGKWKTIGEKLSYALSEDTFRKLSLTLPTSPEDQYQGCFYFSEGFIQEFVENRSLDYLRLVLKAWPSVALKFGLVKLDTLEISFSCLKGSSFSSELIEKAKNISNSGPGILFDLNGKFWKNSTFAGSVRSLKLKYAPYFDKYLAIHLATAFPKLAMFSFTAFHPHVYNQDPFIEGLRVLLEKIPSLRVIKLGDNFDKRALNFLFFLRDMQERATNYPGQRYAFYARKATLFDRSQTELDNSRRVGSNFRITAETYPRIQVQEERPFPNVGLQILPNSPVNRPQSSPVGPSQRTPPRQFPNQPSPTVASSRALSPVDFSSLDDYPLNPSGSISPQPQLVQLSPNPAVATSRAPSPRGLPHDELDLSYFNNLPQNVQPAANIPGNQATSPFRVQQAANQSQGQGQPSPSPAAESTAEIDEFTRMLAERFNKGPNK